DPSGILATGSGGGVPAENDRHVQGHAGASKYHTNLTDFIRVQKKHDTRVVELANYLSCLEASQSFHVGIAKDNVNELTASRDLIELGQPSVLLDLDKQRWKRNSCFLFPKVHLYQFSGVNVKLGEAIEGPDGQEVKSFYTDCFVVAKDPHAAWERLSVYLREQGNACDDAGEIHQVEFPDIFEGEMMWYSSRLFYSKETT
ncbi:MAG TPA: hypothetical protein VFO10_23385, partial [Oligoflexus sp.]|uniref:hypothetical protein n=1 Tax=Oligoflexus sp. TaxID=1971216 RepID=UPI002D80B675